MKLVKTGKVKDVYEIDLNTLEFVFSDRISVFDKIIPSKIPHKGEVLARISAYWFKLITELGVPNHYIDSTAPNRMRVKRVKVIHDYKKLNSQTTNYLIPLECVVRYYLYGSLWDRITKNLITPETLGFQKNHEMKFAEPLPKPFFEVTTKLEKVDRLLEMKESLVIAGISKSEFEQIKEISLKIDQEINSRVLSRGLIHVDGKKEFAFDENRNLIVVDTFGTPDEDRFWDAAEFKKGRYIEKSKEFVRKHYRETGYYERLMQARSKSVEEPAIPPLPPDLIRQTSEIYIQLFEDITDQIFKSVK